MEQGARFAIAGRSRVGLRAVAGLGAETRGAQQRRVCGVQLCSKNGSALYSGGLDCLVLASAS